ncbi:MAG: S9 family peptidase [Acidobacteria bacterium]|nr:S9 family peptidase [Acidobacteriota bacterium]MCA1618605.1 S9 family peptidase [Acidobacteriota bacterium]
MAEAPTDHTERAAPRSPRPAPPVARRAPVEHVLHGDRKVDDYSWLRERANPEVLNYLEAEHAYAAAVMEPTAALQQRLYEEMVGRVRADDASVPYRLDSYSYYARVERGKQQPVYCRRRDAPGAAEEITLDLNELAERSQFVRLDIYAVSNDANLLAFSLDTTGDGRHALFVKDLRTGGLVEGPIERVRSFAWAGETFFYTVEEAETRRAARLFRSAPGRGPGRLVYDESDTLYEVELSRSRDRSYVFATSASKTTTEVRAIAAAQAEAAPAVIAPRRPGHRYYADHHGGRFFIRTDRGAKNFRLVVAPAEDPREECWEEFWPHRAGVKLEGFELFAGHCVLAEREAGLPHLRVIDLRGGGAHRVEFPEPVYGVAPGANPAFDTPLFRLRYSSPVTPASVFDYDMGARRLTLLKRAEVVGGYDASLYACERVFATADDGARIPVSVVYRKDLRRGAPGPLLLYGYGAYGIAAPVAFSAARLSLLDRGVIYAVAHVRGGGELGEEWHEAGKLMSKRNTFTDFIRAAEHLIAVGYTTSERLVVHGDSAGGLLVGAALNLRPELFAAAVLQVPFLDVLNTMLDSTLPLTSGEYLEWGDPNDRGAYEYIKSYSPYDNIRAGDYPAMLVKSSLHDSQVMYWEAAKYVAKLRATKTDDRPLLLRVNMAAGHGGPAGRYDALRELAFDYAFILHQLGLAQ